MIAEIVYSCAPFLAFNGLPEAIWPLVSKKPTKCLHKYFFSINSAKLGKSLEFARGRLLIGLIEGAAVLMVQIIMQR